MVAMFQPIRWNHISVIDNVQKIKCHYATMKDNRKCVYIMHVCKFLKFITGFISLIKITVYFYYIYTSIEMLGVFSKIRL